MLLRRCLLLPFALSCLCAHALELTAGDLRVVFTGPDDRFLGRIEDVATGLRFRGDDPAATFHIALRDAAGTGHLLKAQTAASVTCEATADRVLHRFHFADPEAEVVTRAEVVDGAVQFTLQVRALDAGVVIGEVIYPFLTSMGRPEGDQPDDYVLYPYASGRRMTPRRPAYTWGGGNAYPSAYCTMQMVGYHLQEGRCLYATTPDPLCYTKTYLYGGDGQSFYWGFNHFPEEMWHTTEYATPYPVRFKLVPGDWYDLAREYRQWALQQWWVDAGRLRYRHDLPPVIRNCVWSALDNANVGGADKVVGLQIANRDLLGVPTLAHMYMWHQKIWRMDVRYPDFDPPRPDFPEIVRRLQEAGIPVMPYVNARLWDERADSWLAEDAQRGACRNDRGEIRVEIACEEMRCLHPMDPTVLFWQDKIRDICRMLFERVGVQGIYLDQIAAAPPVLDFSEGRSHPRGGGHWWVDGYQQMLGRLHQELIPPGAARFLTTESLAEPYQRYHAAYLTSAGGADYVPAFQTVYNETIMTFGGSYDTKNLARYRLQMANDLLFGLIFGWRQLEGWHPALPQEGYEAHAQFARKMAALRAADVHMFSLSELLRPPTVEGDNPVLNVTAEEGPLLVKRAVQAGAYRAEDGRVGLCLVNCDELPHTVTVRFPGPASQVFAVTAPGVSPQPVALADGMLTADLPAASGVLYVTQAAGT